ncbi:MAG: exonuclease domain-containing protein [Lachnospirales bacterium]
MNYIVVDFEFNQSYDFRKKIKKENPICPFEIIQIGAVKLDENFEEVESGRFNKLIKPTIYKDIHPHVAKLTGFKKETFENCETFESIVPEFLEFCDVEDVFVVWGDNDIVSLYKNLQYYSMQELPFPKKFINLQKQASKRLKKVSGAQVGLKNAIIEFDIDYNDNFHDAFYDAYYTSEILKKMKKQSMRINTFNLKSLNRKIAVKKESSHMRLYKILEKDVGRRLNNKEKAVVRKAYDIGKSRTLESKK